MKTEKKLTGRPLCHQRTAIRTPTHTNPKSRTTCSTVCRRNPYPSTIVVAKISPPEHFESTETGRTYPQPAQVSLFAVAKCYLRGSVLSIFTYEQWPKISAIAWFLQIRMKPGFRQSRCAPTVFSYFCSKPDLPARRPSPCVRRPSAAG